MKGRKPTTPRKADPAVPMVEVTGVVTPERAWWGKFLTELTKTGCVTKAAKKANRSPKHCYSDRKAFPAFAEAWDEALRIACDLMEGEARRRAVEGVLEPVFYQGAKCGTIRKYDSQLLMFLLKAHDPKYRDNSRVEVTTPPGEPMQHAHTHDVHTPELAAIAGALRDLGLPCPGKLPPDGGPQPVDGR